MRSQPHVYAIHMEAVEAPGEKPPLLPLLEVHQAHRAAQLLLLSRGVDEDRQHREDILGGGGGARCHDPAGVRGRGCD